MLRLFFSKLHRFSELSSLLMPHFSFVFKAAFTYDTKCDQKSFENICREQVESIH